MIMSALNDQEGGDHYKKFGEYQPWKVLSKWMTPDELRGFMKGTVIAYLARERDKGGDIDILKAIHTMQIYMELHDGQVDPALQARDETQETDVDCIKGAWRAVPRI